MSMIYQSCLNGHKSTFDPFRETSLICVIVGKLFLIGALSVDACMTKTIAVFIATTTIGTFPPCEYQ